MEQSTETRTQPSPERVPGKLLGCRVKVAAGYLVENELRGHEQPVLRANLLDCAPDGSAFYFRDVPEVWAALKAEETN